MMKPRRGFSIASLSAREQHSCPGWPPSWSHRSSVRSQWPWLDPYLDNGGESALFFVGVLLVGLLGGVAPAALSAVLSGLLLNYYLIAPRHSFTIAEPNSAITELVLLLIAVAVAVLVDGATNAPGKPGGPPRRRSC